MKPSTERDYHERIVRTLVYIQDHLDDELDLERVASVAAFSSFHFHRIFRGLAGEPFKEYIRRLRLERAARHLKRLGESVTEIALEAGFETHESFTRAFGAMFGVSPSAYRAAHGPEAATAPESASGTHYDDVSGYRPPDYGDPPPVEVGELPPMRLVFLRHVGPYGQVGATWGRLMGWAGARGLLGPGMRLIGIVHDDPDVTPPDKVRYDAAVTVSRPVEPEGEFGVLELVGGACAVLTHRGPYDGLGKAYQRLYGGWLPKSGYELREAPAFEQYLNSPQNTRPEDLLTVIHVPVER
ncbi:MAG TPA: AraC family transcriptional regulator [Bryobacteraceae bacterium]|nr:AraC family transcriptional regulator [Bryobacteraceae bacterium]